MPIGPPWSNRCVPAKMMWRSGRGYASAGSGQMQMGIRRPNDLFAVRDPDILHLGGVLQEPAAFRVLGVEPIDGAPPIRPDLLEVSGGHRLRRPDGSFVSVAPEAVDVIVFGKRFEKLRSIAGHRSEERRV